MIKNLQVAEGQELIDFPHYAARHTIEGGKMEVLMGRQTISKGDIVGGLFLNLLFKPSPKSPVP